jgi:AcrR family transcriptional regulator
MRKAEKSPAVRSVGRPRSEQARQAILAAAREIIDASGPARLTVEAVAQRAGVGKPTIYRYWLNAQELAMSALLEAEAGMSADGRGDLQALVESIVERLNTKRGRQMALMLAAAEPDGELFKAFANRVMLEGRQAGIAIIAAGVARGDIEATLDPGLAMDLILGAIFLRLLLRHAPLDAASGKAAVDIVIPQRR